MKILIKLVILFSVINTLTAMNLHQEVNLKGEWLFEIGDKLAYAKSDFNDSKWEKINVPDRWEDEGFPGYDGYAWYRIKFDFPQKTKTNHLYLKLGRIDDVDMVYLNGHFIGGEGSFPPNYKTAWNIKRLYRIPVKHLKFGEKNILAVRVFDDHGGGGITEGSVGIYSRLDLVELKINLSGDWKFSTGDDSQWAAQNFNDSKWNRIAVPAYWEDQGFDKYDGIAWYRKTIKLPRELTNSKLILLIGKINDIDEVYFNGKLIGRTGRFADKKQKANYKNQYKKERAYFIPPYLIKSGKKNTIAVRVFDVGSHGGIYEGYVGITTREEYLKYTKKKKE